MNWYVGAFKKYVTFSGRARRTEYWMFFLFNVIFSIAAGILDSIFRTKWGSNGLFQSLYSLAVFLPLLAVMTRRLHDTGKSGLWILAEIVPTIGLVGFSTAMTISALSGNTPVGSLIGVVIFGLITLVASILLLVWLCTEGTPGDNKYGPNPKEIAPLPVEPTPPPPVEPIDPPSQQL